MEWIWGHFVILALTSVMLLARRRHPKVTGRTARLTYPWTIKIGGIIGFFLVSAACFMWLRTPDEWWEKLVGGGGFWLVMLLGLAHAWCTEIVFDEECIHASSITGSKTMLWSDVSKITHPLSKHIIHDVHGQRIVVHEYLSGARGFVAYAAQRVQENVFLSERDA
jgi:hypothetical protein